MDADNLTDGRPPNNDEINAHAAQFIDLGDLINEYAHSVIRDGLDDVAWTGVPIYKVTMFGEHELESGLTCASNDAKNAGVPIGGVPKAVFDQRFGIGVKLKGAAGDVPGAQAGSEWLLADHNGEGPGWNGTGSNWMKIKAATRALGPGGLTLFPANGQDTATFLHYWSDEVIRVFEVDVHGKTEVHELDRWKKTQHVPAAVASIDPCREVHG